MIKKWYFEKNEFVPGGQRRSFLKTVSIKILTHPYKSYTRHGKCILEYCNRLFFMLFLINNILCNFTAHAQFFLPHFMLTSAFLRDPYTIENIFTITFSDPAHVFYSTKLPVHGKITQIYEIRSIHYFGDKSALRHDAKKYTKFHQHFV